MYQLKVNHMKNSITLESPQWLADFDRGQEGRACSSRESGRAHGGKEGSGMEDKNLAVCYFLSVLQ